MIKFNIPVYLAEMTVNLENALRTIIDPELNINIVDLGLVYSISIDKDQMLIEVQMTLSSRFCPMGESIVSGVNNCLLRLFKGFNVKVDLVWEPEWTFESITPEGRQALLGK